MTTLRKRVSIIVPFYNEEAGRPSFLRDIEFGHGHCGRRGLRGGLRR